MDRDQLIDLTGRAGKLARDKTTDLAPSEHTVVADTYTSTHTVAQDTPMLMASPHLVAYASELPAPEHMPSNRDGPFDSAHSRRRQPRAGIRQHLPAPPVANRRRTRERAS